LFTAQTVQVPPTVENLQHPLEQYFVATQVPPPPILLADTMTTMGFTLTTVAWHSYLKWVLLFLLLNNVDV
jgi:hypothetical protein